MPSSANNYDYIVAIWYCISFLPIGTVPLAGALGRKLISLSLSQYEKKPFLGIYAKLVTKTIIYMCPILIILLFSFHIVAMVRLHEYISGVFLESTTTDVKNSEIEGFLLASHIVFSFIPLIAAIVYLIYYVCKEESMELLVEALLILNIIYLGYFLPYMIIAFVDNPLHAIFVYILLLIFIAFVPLMLFIVAAVILHFRLKDPDDEDKTFAMTFGMMGITFTGGYYLACLVFLFTIGGFNNFKDLRNLLWLVLGTILTAFAGHTLKIMKERSRKKKEDKDPNYMMY